MNDGDLDFWKAVVSADSSSKEVAQIRLDLLVYTAEVFKKAGEELYEVGHIFGSDRVQGKSPGAHGSDEAVAVAMLLRIGGQLVSSFADLFTSHRQYAAAALLRQVVEIEYLAWAFQTRDADAEKWLRSDRDERQTFFAPKKLRAAADGKFRGKDYGYHCELGGHPVPGASVLLANDAKLGQLLVVDLLGHAGRIWDHVILWAVERPIGAPVLQCRGEMLARYKWWKENDVLSGLPPPP